MNNETDVSIRFKNYVSGEGKLEKYAQTLAKIKSFTDGIDSAKIKDLESGASATKEVNDETKKMAKNVNSAFNYTVIRGFVRGLKSAYTMMGKLTNQSASYLENINLFQVAFNGAYQEAERFINKMSEMYGLDESGLTNTVGIFRQLANAMNLSVETGTKLATLLTQMSVDISSLYNIDISRASSVLQSSLAGQTKPIRGATGADITESTLQTTLNTIGLDKYVGDLSYAEKRLLIIISLTEQLSESTNDFARTIESPANQMRILNEQWERLTRAVGNVFLPILSKILPYLNAIMMVLTEIINTIATLVGYNQEDYDYFAGTADSVLELEDSLGGATEKAKQLKQGLRGFDKLNVIKTPSANDAGGGAGGVDPKIMDAFNKAFDEYNSKLTDVTMKATKIRDAIMEWLGFTKKINTETGKVYFQFEKLTSGTVLGALAVGGTIYSGIYLVSQFLAKIGIISQGLPSLFTLLKEAVVGIAGALGISAGWVVAIGVALVALVAVIITYWEEIKNFVVNLAGTVGNFFVDLWKKIDSSFIKPITTFFSTLATFIYDNVIKPVIDFFAPIVEAIVSIFSLVIEKTAEIVVGITKAVWEILKKIGEIFAKIIEISIAIGKAFYDYIIEPIFEFIGNLFSEIYNKVIKPVLNVFGDVGKWVYDKIIKPIVDWIVWLKDKAVEIFKGIGTTVVTFISDVFKSVINGVLTAIETGVNGFIKLLNGAIGIINEIPGVEITKISLLKIPRLEKGMDFVPKDFYGPVYLDYGERVLTKEENRDYSAGLLAGGNQTQRSVTLNPTFVIQVGDEVIAKKVLTDLQDMAKSDGKPIVIS